MQKWSDFERQSLQLMKKPEVNLAKCSKCGSEYFEQISAQKFNADQVVVVGQRLSPAETQIFLRCVKCGEAHEPMVNYVHGSKEGNEYEAFRDMMDKDLEVKKDEVPSQGHKPVSTP